MESVRSSVTAMSERLSSLLIEKKEQKEAMNALDAQLKALMERVSAYSQFDMDGDGLLSANELAIACNISVYKAKQIIFEYDENGDGMLDEQEFNHLKKTIRQQ